MQPVRNGRLPDGMNRIGLSFYSVFVIIVAFAVAAVATLAQNFAPRMGDKPVIHAAKVGGAAALTDKAAAASGTEKPSADNTSTEAPNDEKGYRKRLTGLISPLLELKVPDADQLALKEATKALGARNPDGAKAAAAKITLAAARKLVTWSILRSGYGRPEDYQAFLANSPMWPDRGLIRRRLEQSLFIDGGSARQILAQFKDAPPKFDAGLAAMASAYLALGEKDKASSLAAKAWCGGGIAASREQPFLQRFGALLSSVHHACRLDRLLVDNLRWTSARKRRAHAIRRVIKLLDEKDQKKATARLAAFLRQKVATKWISAIPQVQRKNDWGLAFQRVQHFRLRKKHAAAWKLLQAVPVEPAKITSPDAWWQERHANALNALKARKFKLAYKLIEKIRPTSVNAAKEQAFFAGWLALRKQKKPKLALEHFKQMLSLVDGPLSSSKAHYWLARSYAKLGQPQEAAKHYQAGAKFRDTFHGQLAKQTFAPNNRAIVLPLPVLPNADDVKRFLENDAVHSAVIAHRAGLPRGQVLKFFRAIAKGLKGEAEIALLAQLASALDDGQLEVRTGKTGVARGFNMYIYSYPVGRLPAYKPLRPPPERAVVLAIARQESEFSTRIVSGAGARGVLQVMPITARHICQQYKIKCRIKDLLDKPSYNARIATAYIADRSDEFAGSYILTFTGYNAGPGRTRQWLREIGDPRAKSTSSLDWIYRIPFKETRLYAQKVLSNVQVYRARLGIRKPLRLVDDMNRGKPKS